MKNTGSVEQGKILRAALPPGRDPFVNTPLLPAGRNAEGEERFWISSWNSVAGCTGALITESGKERIFRFEPPHSGFYSAALEDDDTLWLCGDLSRVVRLKFSSGEVECYETGAPSALVFQGMILDHATGKLFAAASPDPRPAAFSFDYKNRKPVKVYEDICDEQYMRAHFPNGDGTYSSTMMIPGLALMQWNPAAETLEKVLLHEQMADATLPLRITLEVDRLIGNEENGYYFPHCGWYDPQTRRLSCDGPRPQQEMVWFGRRDHLVWGLSTDKTNRVVGVWDLRSGEVKDLCTIVDATPCCAALTSSGKVVAVSVYGDFYRFDGESGALEISKRLATDSVGMVDCLCRIDEDRLLGTPFITQRFWEVNLQSGQGYDCGRAAPGGGEVLLTWKMRGRIYLAAYIGGELMEYDPTRHPHFPENPRVVAAPPAAMRPAAAADDGENIFYSCNHKYGKLGCVLTQYNTATGLAFYRDDPLPGQAIRGWRHDAGTRTLLAGTTRQADCGSAEPISAHCGFARFDADDFTLLEQCEAPAGTEAATVLGALGASRYLCEVNGVFDGASQTRWFALDIAAFQVPSFETMKTYPASMRGIAPTAQPGLFVLWIDDQLELWDMNREQSVTMLHSMAGAYRFFVQDDAVYIVEAKAVTVLDGCLKEFYESAD